MALQTQEPSGRTDWAPTPVESGPAFARHETFPPRSGWLKKGFDAAVESKGQIFLQEDAQARLGVGKNMARAIRYWCHAFRLLRDEPLPGERTMLSRPTEFGARLLGVDGWDPFLEDTASLWYLHWQLVRGAHLATAWHYAFTLFAEREFTPERLTMALQEHVQRVYPTARAATSSLHKDVLCLARMYGDAATAREVTEDTIQCPFAELGLLHAGAEPKSYVFDVGAKADLPNKLMVATCLEHAARVAPGARTVAVARLLFDAGSPGMAFKLTESALTSAVEQVALETKDVALADTAGLVQVAFRSDPHALAQELVASHYVSSAILGRR
jgi:hypothetical protein